MEMVLPECPVCLQIFTGEEEEETIPRVLSCGHSVCQSCLSRLPHPFPNTIRCPSCTQLISFPPPPQGPSSLPKNIALLSFMSQFQQNPKPTNSSYPKHLKQPHHDFLSGFSPDEEFYNNWKNWILPMDLLSINQTTSDGSCEDLFSVLYESRVNSEIIHPLLQGWGFRGIQMVSLLHVVTTSLNKIDNGDDSKVVFNLSYTARVMEALNRLREEERTELRLILNGFSSFRQSRVCKVYGFWMNPKDGSVFLVCQRFDHKKLLNGELRHFIIKEDDENEEAIAYGDNEPTKESKINNFKMSNFALVGVDLCEGLIGLHSEGLVCGCLALSCFTVNDLGHIFVDPNHVLVLGRRIRNSIAEIDAYIHKGTSDELDREEEASYSNSLLLQTQAFVSPEVLFRLYHGKGTASDSDSLGYVVGYGTDIWSLACILILLLLGDSFSEGLSCLLYHFLPSSNQEKCDDLLELYNNWVNRVSDELRYLLGTEFASLHHILCKCLDFDPGTRPHVTDLLRCIRGLIIKSNTDILVSLDAIETDTDDFHCLILSYLCDPRKEIARKSEGQNGHELQESDHVGADSGHVRDAIDGLLSGKLKSINLQNHLDCITGLAVGGGFLFSSSFDKTIHVWSLQNFSHVQSLKGHENRVMAIVFVDAEKPLCISGDSGGGIFVWQIGIHLGQEPLKKWFELKDWRYSGIHALAVSGTKHLYTGSGDKSIKAWSLQDYTLTCTMSGHKSVVSSLAVGNGVLYSGSWDGTIRLWSLNNHSPLTVLGDDVPGIVVSVLSLLVKDDMLVAAYENGSVKIWSNDVLSKSMQPDSGAILALDLNGKWLFTGGWTKTINIQEVSRDELHVDVKQIGSISCDSVVTALLYNEGKLYVGFADSVLKVYSYEA